MPAKNILWIFLVTLFVSLPVNVSSGQTRDEKVRQDKIVISMDDQWYYDDLELGIEAARKTNRPLMVVLRCIP